jgi:hypothetical protein
MEQKTIGNSFNVANLVSQFQSAPPGGRLFDWPESDWDPKSKFKSPISQTPRNARTCTLSERFRMTVKTTSANRVGGGNVTMTNRNLTDEI